LGKKFTFIFFKNKLRHIAVKMTSRNKWRHSAERHKVTIIHETSESKG